MISSRIIRLLSLAPALFILALCLAGCKAGKKWQNTTLFIWDTVCDVQLYASPDAFQEAQEELNDLFTRIAGLFSPDSQDLTDPLVLDLFRKSRLVWQESDGAFDVTVGPLSRLWGFQAGTPHLPRPEEVETTLALVGMEKIRDEETRLVLEPGMRLDWGGIAKGLGVDLAVKKMKERGIGRGCINAGGDLRCWGLNPQGGAWRIGVQHPRQDGFLGILLLQDHAAATSGDYQRYFKQDGIRYHHLFDPKTGYPVQGMMSVTVTGPEASLCDALSTALFISREPEKIMQEYPDYGAILVDSKSKMSFVGKKSAWMPQE